MTKRQQEQSKINELYDISYDLERIEEYFYGQIKHVKTGLEIDTMFVDQHTMFRSAKILITDSILKR